MVWIWASVFIVSLIIEIVTVELASIWFTFGSLVSFILALCGVGETVQIVVFLAVSFVLLACLRAIFMKFLKNNKETTNLDSLIGTVHTLQSDIGEEKPGEIKLNGVVWRAVSQESEAISAGSKVQIVEVQGNKFIVKKAETEDKEELNSEVSEKKNEIKEGNENE